MSLEMDCEVETLPLYWLEKEGDDNYRPTSWGCPRA